jgi:hypothetical protein
LIRALEELIARSERRENLLFSSLIKHVSEGDKSRSNSVSLILIYWPYLSGGGQTFAQEK